MSKAKEEFFKLTEQHGIEVTYYPGGKLNQTPFAAEIILDLLHGKVFAGSGTHSDYSLCHSVEEDGTRTNWPRSLAALKDIVQKGLEDCPDRPDCDICDDDFCKDD